MSNQYEPDIESGTPDQAPPARTPLSPAEASTAHLANCRHAAEQQREAIDKRRFRDPRAQIFAEGDRRRAIQVAEGKFATHQATQRDADYLRRTALNDTFARLHGDLLEGDRAAALAQNFAASLMRDEAYGSASPEQLADVVAQSVRRQLAGPEQVLQTTAGRQDYIAELRGQRTRGTPARGLRTWKG